ncbi:GTP-binding protein [Candidatus Woesearchaeota archaeon]|nr:GTP-binding protein [Candidatus Woesearchaeota archaeon]
MAIPHVVQKQLIKKRLRGKAGKARLLEIDAIIQELPGYNTGPYGELKKWLQEEKRKTKTKSKILHQDWFGVKKEGHKQFVLVGCPNIGKSSLISRMSGLQTKVAGYEFTTLKPIPGIVNINGADFQIVDLPGLVEGASDDAGEGKRFLGIVRTSDGIILMHDLTKPVSDAEKMARELEKAEIQKPIIVVGSKLDLARKNLQGLQEHFPDKSVIGISNETGEGHEQLKQAVWKTSNLIRVFPKDEQKPVILEKGSVVKDFVKAIHTKLVERFKQARVTGPSAKFPNQQVGLKHELEDNDRIELVLRK